MITIFAETQKFECKGRGVDTFFKTLAKLASSSVFSLAKSKQNGQDYRKGQ
jgi:hypothetical protein